MNPTLKSTVNIKIEKESCNCCPCLPPITKDKNKLKPSESVEYTDKKVTEVAVERKPDKDKISH